MTKFSEIAIEDFPLNYFIYNDLMVQIRTAASGFACLGTADGRAVDNALMKVWAGLHETWELIQDIERREHAG